jgi:hypothetical protein
MRFVISRLRWPEWVIGAGALLLLAAMLLLPWYELTQASGGAGPKYYITVSVDGWNGLHNARWLLLVTSLLGLAAFVTQATRRAPAVPVTLCLFASLLGGLSGLWLIYRVLINPPGGREIGGWIGLIAACAIAYGGFESLRMEGIAPSDAPAEIPTIALRTGTRP